MTRQLIRAHVAAPANTKHSPSVGTMLAYRLRRWPNIVPALDERLVFAGTCPPRTD